MKRFAGFVLIIALILSMFTMSVQAEDYSISFENSTKSASRLTDGNVSSDITFEENEVITVELSGALSLMLKWYEPCAYEIELISSGGEAAKTSYDDTIINKYIDLAGAETAKITLPNGGRLCDIEVFYTKPPADTQVWEQPYEKLDILVLSAHPDDEYLYFGGTLPYYGTQMGLNVNAVWLSHQKRLRQDEALNALWAMGVTHYPEFIGFPDRLKKTYESAAQFWGEEKTLSTIVELYRKYKPEVVVTHDPKGEYGHGAHMVTSALAIEAATAAADETLFPESAEKYGIWQVKKIYLHLLKYNKIYMGWDEPMDAFGGKTAMEMAKIGYSYHKSQHIYNLRVSYDSRYTCTNFGLAFTTVGADMHGGDFLENIAAKNFTNYIEPEEEAEPEPEPAATQEPAAQDKPEPTVRAQSTPQPQSTQQVMSVSENRTAQTGALVIMGIGAFAVVVALAVAVWAIVRTVKKRSM